jgi:hypothetical protein
MMLSVVTRVFNNGMLRTSGTKRKKIKKLGKIAQ